MNNKQKIGLILMLPLILFFLIGIGSFVYIALINLIIVTKNSPVYSIKGLIMIISIIIFVIGFELYTNYHK